MKIITKIYLSIGFILFFFVFATGIFIKQSLEADKNLEKTLTSTEIVKSLVTLHRAVISVQTGLRGYILASNESFLEPYYGGQAAYLKELKHLRSLCAQKPENLKLLNQIDLVYIDFKDSIAKPLIFAHKIRNSSNLAQKNFQNLYNKTFTQAQGKIKIDKIINYLQRLEKSEEKLKTSLVNKSRASHKITWVSGIVLTTFAILVGLFTTILLGKTIEKRIKELKNLAENLANENFLFTIEDTSQDELSSLATDMQRMALKLETSFSRLQKMNKELDQMAFFVSHDLKAPLRAINNLAKWIEEDLGDTTAELKTNLNLMRGRVQRMDSLINGILDYARIGRVDFEKTTFFINSLLQEILESLEIPSTFKINLPATNLQITTQKILLHQVLANLIGNAVKYNDKEAGIITIQVSVQKENILFSVSDNGMGIPQKYQEKVFGVFQTIKASNSKESTGIGLAIAKKIVEDQGGAIWLESELYKGAIFYFTWPLLAYANPKIISIENN